MDLKFVDNELRRALELVGDSTFTSIERDIVLEHLRRAYEHLRFDDAVPMQKPQSAPSSVQAAADLAGAVSALVEDVVAEEKSAEEPEIEVELIMSDEIEDEEVAKEPAEEEVAEPAEIPVPSPIEETVAEESEEETVVEESEAVVELGESEAEPAAEMTEEVVAPFTEQSLFGDDALLTVQSKSSRRRAIMSLYEESVPVAVEHASIEPSEDPLEEMQPELVTESVVVEPVDEVGVESADEPQPELQPEEEVAAVEPDMVLGDMYRQESHTTIGESVAAQPTVAESCTVDSLRGSIGVADRFMLIRDLFDGDAQLYEKSITKLDACDSLDDCIVYIVENFSWRPSSEGAKLIMDLLQRKFR